MKKKTKILFICTIVVAIFSVIVYVGNIDRSESSPVVSTKKMNATLTRHASILSSEEEKELVNKAYNKASSGIKIDDKNNYKISYEGDFFIVTWPYIEKDLLGRPPSPGPDYIARVKIDINTGDIVEILVGE